MANSTYPADFLSENLQIQVNLLDAAVAARVPRLLFLGSSCIYPKYAPQPIKESALLTGHSGADKRRIRDRQDCGHHSGPGRQASIWPVMDLRDANQPVRTG